MSRQDAKIIGSAVSAVVRSSAAPTRKAAALDEIAKATVALDAGERYFGHLNAALDILG